jgi:hypothetical protein
MSQLRQEHRSRSNNFLALILIGIGAIWLLGQTNILSGASFAMLARVWPVILIAIGINILIARNNPTLSFMVGAATIIMLLALMIVGPALGWVSTPEIQTESLSEPLGDASRAQVQLDLSIGEATVRAAQDSNNLITADVNYLGDLRFDVSGSGTRVVHLYNENQESTSFFTPFWDWGNDSRNLRWDINLTTAVPIDLQVNGGVGESTLDLSDLQLTNLDVNTGVGGVNVTLPAGDYAVDISGGVGGTDIRIAEGAALNITVNAGVGGTTIDVPNGVAVRLDANGGLGGVDVPNGWERISGENDNGVWQTADYASASAGARITIDYNGGVGGLTIR